MKIEVKLKKEINNSYFVYIDKSEKVKISGKTAIISNMTILNLHKNSIFEMFDFDESFLIIVQDGEEFKNLKTIENILDEMFKSKLNRNSTILAFGGGVIGDMSGFAASIYQRGINFIQVPTTLLSQVDASVGGKTGINNKFGKNLIGSFYQPKAVYCHTKFLKTLPQREFNAGIAEIVKMAVMFDKSFFFWLEKTNLQDEKNLEHAIEKSIQIKANIIAKDEKENGIRAALNYGHTFGHVVENQTQYRTYLHGEAVSIGMVMANALAYKVDLLSLEQQNRIKNILIKFNLPIFYEIKNNEEFFNAFYLDKKSKDSKIIFVLPKGIGDFEFYSDPSKDDVIDILKDFN